MTSPSESENPRVRFPAPPPSEGKGFLYILCIQPAYFHAKHYVGFTPGNPSERINTHLARKGSPLIRAALNSGHSVKVAFIDEGTRDDERRIKNGKNSCRFCPFCRDEYLKDARERMRRIRDNKKQRERRMKVWVAGDKGRLESLPIRYLEDGIQPGKLYMVMGETKKKPKKS